MIFNFGNLSSFLDENEFICTLVYEQNTKKEEVNEKINCAGLQLVRLLETL